MSSAGLAILLILLVNVSNMGNSVYEHFGDARLLGWRPADQVCWWIIRIFVDGTQRGLLEFLFGAGALLLLKKTLRPDGPVAIADLYFRRNLWLVAFGLFDIFGLFWFGDILFPYGIAALLLFPLRRLGAKALLALALAYVAFVTIQAEQTYQHRSVAYASAQAAQAKEAVHQPLTTDDTHALSARAKVLGALHTPPSAVAEERAARLGPFRAYARWLIHIWLTFVYGEFMLSYVVGIFFSAVIGMALFKLGITQGERSVRFYLLLAVCCYIPGLALRISAAWIFTRFNALPNHAAVFTEPARLLVTLGHVALLNLIVPLCLRQTPHDTASSCRTYRLLALPYAELSRHVASLPRLCLRSLWPLRLVWPDPPCSRHQRRAAPLRDHLAALLYHGAARVDLAFALLPEAATLPSPCWTT